MGSWGASLRSLQGRARPGALSRCGPTGVPGRWLRTPGRCSSAVSSVSDCVWRLSAALAPAAVCAADFAPAALGHAEACLVPPRLTGRLCLTAASPQQPSLVCGPELASLQALVPLHATP